MVHNSLPGLWSTWADHSLQNLEDASLLRTLRRLQPTQDPTRVQIEGDVLQAWITNQTEQSPQCHEAVKQQQLGNRSMRTVKLFSSNDYLGLSSHVKVRHAAAYAALAYGTGPRSSALVGGYTQQHADLEAALAELKGQESALLCPSGFAANTAAVAAVASSPESHIYSDALNHASIIDGARQAQRAGAHIHVYRHRDLTHLEQLLASSPPGARMLVATDALFSMDGTWADIPGLTALRRKYGFLLLVDEAHSSLVVGPRGGGRAAQCGVEAEVDLSVGTLSKAFGAHGGFVACGRALRAIVLNRGRPVVFSTALPAPLVAAAHTALLVSQEESWRQEHLLQLWQLLGRQLGVEADSPIVTIRLGSAAAALAAGADLLSEGFFVPAIRPPTVPEGTARLRISLSAAHSTEDVVELAAALRRIGLAPTAARPEFSTPPVHKASTRTEAKMDLSPSACVTAICANSTIVCIAQCNNTTPGEHRTSGLTAAIQKEADTARCTSSRSLECLETKEESGKFEMLDRTRSRL